MKGGLTYPVHTPKAQPFLSEKTLWVMYPT